MPPPEDTEIEHAVLAHTVAHTVVGLADVVRLIDYMKDRLALVPVTEIGDLITSGFVTIAAGAPAIPGRPGDLIANGDCITIDRGALAALESGDRWSPPWSYPVSILHEDDDLLVVEKPGGMHVHPLGDKRGHTLVNALLHHAGARGDFPWANWRPHAVQRLDCVVSGVLAVAKNAEAKTTLMQAQKRREVGRTYHAMVSGCVVDDKGTIDAPLGRPPERGPRRILLDVAKGGFEALTRWKVIERRDDRTLVELRPATGRTHQLRVHLSSIGHPIVGDSLYANAELPVRLGEGDVIPIALHATSLQLHHPSSGKPMEFHSSPPAGFGYDTAPATFRPAPTST